MSKLIEYLYVDFLVEFLDFAIGNEHVSPRRLKLGSTHPEQT